MKVYHSVHMTGFSVIAITVFLGKLHQIWNTTRQKTMSVVKRLRDSNEVLQEESHIDPLTGLYNRNMLRTNYEEYKNPSARERIVLPAVCSKKM